MEYSTLIIVHAVVMSSAFVSATTGIIIAKFYKKKMKSWQQVHKRLGLTAACTGIVGVIGGFYLVQTTYGMHFLVPHAYFGYATTLLLIATPTLAFVFLKSKGTAQIKKRLRIVHRWAGRLTGVMVLLTIVYGIIASGWLS